MLVALLDELINIFIIYSNELSQKPRDIHPEYFTNTFDKVLLQEFIIST